jgi:1-acyl-sn-glycerol-3-phosphate acyltransferase
MTEPHAELDTRNGRPADDDLVTVDIADRDVPELLFAEDTDATADLQPGEPLVAEADAPFDEQTVEPHTAFVVDTNLTDLTFEVVVAEAEPVEVIDIVRAAELDEEYDEESLRQRLVAELMAMSERITAITPGRVRSLTTLSGKLVDRLRGNYAVDEFGLDPEFRQAVMPFFNFMYDSWWRVEVHGAENVPTSGRALLVSNHSGVLPWDGAMIFTGLEKTMQPPRLARALVANWFPTLPFLSIFLTKTGQVMASHQNGERLLESDELVVVFPEGYKGVGKLYRDRYNLARFGRGGFIRMALKTGAPIIPVAVTGAEETYPMVYNAKWLAKMIGFPYFPVTLTFPWLGLLGFIPLPSKWHIDIGEPIVLPDVDERAMANPVTVARLTEQVRSTIQGMLYARLRQRTTIFLG